jgi:hypothetical protein
MSTPELKKKLIGKITATDDEKLLQEVYRLLEISNYEFEPYELNEEQINVVQESQEDVKKGKFLPGDEADKEIDEWTTMRDKGRA